MPQSLGTAGHILVLHGFSQEGGGKLRHRVIRLRGVQVIGRQLRVKDAFAVADSPIVHLMEDLLAVVENQLLTRQRKALHGCLHRRQGAHAPLPGNAQAAVSAQIQGAGLHVLRQRLHFRQSLHLGAVCLGRSLCRPPKAILIDEPDKFQSLEQLIQLRLVIGSDNGISGLELDGSLRPDGSKVIG